MAPRARSRINGLVNGSALVGIAATPPVFGWMIDLWDWPVSYLIMGGLTAIVALTWASLARVLNVMDVAVALPALIGAVAVWGVVTGTGHL